LTVLFSTEEFNKLKTDLVLYRCALNNVKQRVDTLLEDFINLQQSNPIEHVKARIKSFESIAEKLHRRGFDVTAESACKNLHDIAGIRCICSYADDIHLVARILRRQADIKILIEKDYISDPKPSGYRSYHLIIEVPVYLTDRTEYLPVEMQIRTQAMDFWATLEHKVRYKYNNIVPPEIAASLRECADQIIKLDGRMYNIKEKLDADVLGKNPGI